jgi:protein-S-isoprenylcysteine O-methyltransferase Ste14
VASSQGKKVHDDDAPPILDIRPPGSRFTFALDMGERLIVVVLTILFLARLIPHVGDGPYNMLIMVSEGMTALCMVIRRAGPMATTPYAWIIAMVGTWSPLLVMPSGLQLLPVSVATGLMVAGLICSISAKIFLRRSFGIVAANRGVQRDGPYRAVRHPIYFGYLITQAGYLAISFSGWNLLVYTACWLAMVLRIRAEEAVLGEDEAYREYRKQVRYRLLPSIW